MVGTRYNSLINSHFKGCQLLASVFVEHYKSDFSYYYIGDTNLVGVFDGKTAWIAAASSCISVKNLLQLVIKASEISEHETESSQQVELRRTTRRKIRVQLTV